jgi:uncharacterized protein YycO
MATQFLWRNDVNNRDNIKSGDLLIWSKDKNSSMSNMFLNLVRLMTRSEFAHVAIAMRLDGRLYVLEASIPNVRLLPVRDEDTFYHIPTDVDMTKDLEDFIVGKLGLPYSFGDCIRAYFGMTLRNDDRYQCAELSHEFYTKAGYDLPSDAFTPSKVVYAILNESGRSLRNIPAIA